MGLIERLLYKEKDTAMSTQAVFDKYASQYDDSREKLIPCFKDFYQISIETIPFQKEKNIDVLDLGAGTGLMAGLVASNYPNAKIHLIDIAEKMLLEAKQKLKFFKNEFDFIVSNYSNVDSFSQNYDLIISSLSIHHLTAIEKQRLFKTIYSHLKSGGIFINADQILGDTEGIEKTYRSKWIEQVKERGTNHEELNAALERMKEDKMTTLSSQMQWLKDAGFTNVNCWFKHYSFVVFSGIKY